MKRIKTFFNASPAVFHFLSWSCDFSIRVESTNFHQRCSTQSLRFAFVFELENFPIFINFLLLCKLFFRIVRLRIHNQLFYRLYELHEKITTTKNALWAIFIRGGKRRKKETLRAPENHQKTRAFLPLSTFHFTEESEPSTTEKGAYELFESEMLGTKSCRFGRRWYGTSSHRNISKNFHGLTYILINFW